MTTRLSAVGDIRKFGYCGVTFGGMRDEFVPMRKEWETDRKCMIVWP